LANAIRHFGEWFEPKIVPNSVQQLSLWGFEPTISTALLGVHSSFLIPRILTFRRIFVENLLKFSKEKENKKNQKNRLRGDQI
jgi:hypothetical protein